MVRWRQREKREFAASQCAATGFGAVERPSKGACFGSAEGQELVAAI